MPEPPEEPATGAPDDPPRRATGRATARLRAGGRSQSVVAVPEPLVPDRPEEPQPQPEPQAASQPEPQPQPAAPSGPPVGSAADPDTVPPPVPADGPVGVAPVETREGGDAAAAPPGRLRLVSLLLALAAVVLAIAAIVLGLALRDRRTADRDRAAAVAAARQESVNFTTIDYQHLDRDLDRVAANATGDFKREFLAARKDVAPLVQQNQAVSLGEVVDAAAVTSTSRRATVLVIANSTVRSTQLQQGAVRNFRLKLTLERIGGRWLVSDLEPVA